MSSGVALPLQPAAHWAARFIGHPWTPATDCWWLVREYFAQRHGIAMPHVDVRACDNTEALRHAVRASGWVPAQGEPREDDVVVMSSPFHRRHVGVMVRADGRLGLLHNEGSDGARGPRGGVVFQTLADATSDGYGNFSVWRRA